MEHNISFNRFKDSARNVFGRTKSNTILQNVIGVRFEENVVALLRKRKFSLFIDESMNISTGKILCTCVRLFHPEVGKIVTLFWKLIQMFSGEEPDKANEGATTERLYV